MGRTAIWLRFVPWALVALIAGGVGCGGEDALPPAAPAATFFSGPVPRSIAHRGGRGLWPENTLYAFEHALAMGVQILETDVWSTEDGAIVIHHDPDVERTTDGTGLVNELSLSEIKALDAAWDFSTDGGATHPLRGQGIRIPTLDEALDRFTGARFLIEIKQQEPPIEEDVLSIIRAHGMSGQVCIGSFYDSVVWKVRDLAPGICTGAGTLEVIGFVTQPLEVLRQVESLPMSLQIPEEEAGIPVLSEEIVAKARDLGVETYVWTINNAEDMRRILGLGVHGIITDYPDRLLAVLNP